MTFTSALLLSSLLGATPQGEVLDFSATWCGPCQQMSPVVSRLERQGYPIRKVDFDQNKALAKKYGVTSLPTFLLIVKGKEVNRIEGMTSEGQLKRMLSQIPTAPVAKKKSSSRLNISLPKLGKRRSVPKSSDIRLVDERKSKTSFQFPSLFGNHKKEAPRERTIDSPKPPRTATPAKNSNHSYPRQLQEMQQAAPSVVKVNPASASCRLQVRENSGLNFGSGTIIASQPGKTILLTCGHIFRDLKPESEIQVDIFSNGQTKKFLGTVIKYDKEADVGLLSIASREVFPLARVARIGQSASKSDVVLSIGCNAGKTPTKQQLRVTALNRYLGPDNIECTGIPVQGRSGGGLFNRNGEIIGVCIAADPKEKRGLYAGLNTIHKLLEETDLARLYRTENETNPALATKDVPATDRLEPIGKGQTQLTSLEEASDKKQNPFSRLESTQSPLRKSTTFSEDQKQLMQAAMQEAGEADVICFVRPAKNSKEKSRVIIIHRASDKFKNYLSHEEGSRSTPIQKERRETPVSHPYSRPHSHESEQELTSPFERDQPRSEIRSSISDNRLIQTSARETEPASNIQPYRRTKAKQ